MKISSGLCCALLVIATNGHATNADALPEQSFYLPSEHEIEAARHPLAPREDALAKLEKGLDDDAIARACIATGALGYPVAFFGSLLAPWPSDLAFARAAYGINLTLKFCPGVLFAPPDIEQFPNSGDQCFAEFKQPRIQQGYSNFLGFPLCTDDSFIGKPLCYGNRWDSGEGLGTPEMFAYNSSLSVRAILPGQKELAEVPDLTLGTLLAPTIVGGLWGDRIYQGCDDSNGTVEKSDQGFDCPYYVNRRIFVPVGNNGVTWRAETLLSPLDVLDIPLPKAPPGAKVPVFKQVIKAVAKKIFKKTIFPGTWRHGVFTDRGQSITVWDVVDPLVRLEDPNNETVFIEADEVGGVSARRWQQELRAMFNVTDKCDRPTTFGATYPDSAKRAFWPVDDPFDITWEARDPGPNVAGERNLTTFAQRIVVQDTSPPILVAPTDIVVVTNGPVQAADLDLGQPLVFDVVDLNPTIVNDASFPLAANTIHNIRWTAEDQSGNVSEVTQRVNVKTSNLEPSAIAQQGQDTVNAVSFEPIEITLRGSDPDNDPLTFFVEEYPENGFFIAPLYPYFIEDFRLEANLTLDDLEQQCLDGIDRNGSFIEVTPRALSARVLFSHRRR